ncbi:hypothetical protein GQS_08310 [Thermococcus sp. 4557]|nr:hypothetical protein [Thermococcus sp. 4557]AEK73556.1 hypothetical protein GQS_08310 [Thermococcus sp. 4557]
MPSEPLTGFNVLGPLLGLLLLIGTALLLFLLVKWLWGLVRR